MFGKVLDFVKENKKAIVRIAIIVAGAAIGVAIVALANGSTDDVIDGVVEVVQPEAF
jgi:hypothetical protein